MGRKAFWPERIKEIDSLIGQGLEMTDIARHYGVSRQRMYQIFQTYNIETPKRNKKHFLQGKPPKYHWAARSLRDRGFNSQSILEAFKTLNLPDYCPMLGCKLLYEPTCRESGYSGRSEDSPSIDKINPTKGYVVDNIQVISWRANRIKNDSTLEELEKIYNYMKRL